MGSGSGLDADLLDGHDWSFFQSQIDNINNATSVLNNSVCRLLGGFAIQAFVANAVVGTVVTFPTAFNGNPLAVIVQSTTGDWDTWVDPSKWTPTTFTVGGSKNYNKSPSQIQVIAIGRI